MSDAPSSSEQTNRLRENDGVAPVAGAAEAGDAAMVRVAAIDGLRAVACLAVVTHHCVIHAGNYDWPVIGRGLLALHLSKVLSLGYIGVELFFVISGFCLGRQLLAEHGARINWRLYAYRRFVRIFPPYWAVFLILAVCIGPWDGPAAGRYWIYGFLLWGILFNASFWTLAVELRWYFALPLLAIIHRKWGMRTVLTLTMVLSLSYKVFAGLGLPWWPKLNFILGPVMIYLPTFALGLLLASDDLSAGRNGKISCWLRANVRLIAFLALLGVFAFVPAVGEREFLSYMRIVPASILAASLVLLALADAAASRVLGNPLLQLLGAASYSIYLVHEPLVRLIYYLLGPVVLTPAGRFWLFQGAVLPLVVCIGVVFHLQIEKRVVALARHWLMPRGHHQRELT